MSQGSDKRGMRLCNEEEDGEWSVIKTRVNRL